MCTTPKKMIFWECNIRGITLNYVVSQLVNFDLIKNMVLDSDDNATVTVHTDKLIKRKRQGRGLYIVADPKTKYTGCLFSSGVVYLITVTFLSVTYKETKGEWHDARHESCSKV
jgi:hypothetical protein